MSEGRRLMEEEHLMLILNSASSLIYLSPENKNLEQLHFSFSFSMSSYYTSDIKANLRLFLGRGAGIFLSQLRTINLICIVGSGVQTGSTRHVGHLLAYSYAQNTSEDRQLSYRTSSKKRKGRKHGSVTSVRTASLSTLTNRPAATS
jgi:hypothetical protein